VDFLGVVKRILQGGGNKSDKISFYQLEINKTFFWLKFDGKMSNIKSMGSSALLPTPM